MELAAGAPDGATGSRERFSGFPLSTIETAANIEDQGLRITNGTGMTPRRAQPPSPATPAPGADGPAPESRPRDDEAFVQAIAGHQSRLYAYIVSLLGDRDQANDVLQETNVVLWRKAGEFEAGTSFAAWAYRIAYFQVLALRRRQSRERVVFSDRLVGRLAEEAVRDAEGFDSRRRQLERCLDDLPPRHRQLLELRYRDAVPVETLAGALGRSANAVALTLFRIRRRLSECIERHTSHGEA
jgi:RNA polymerase sigma-70 factor (ECF subfamily)